MQMSTAHCAWRWMQAGGPPACAADLFELLQQLRQLLLPLRQLTAPGKVHLHGSSAPGDERKSIMVLSRIA